MSIRRILECIAGLLMVCVLMHVSSALPEYRVMAQAGPSNGVLSVNPSSLAFGAQAVDTQSAAQQITLMNTGTGPLGSIAFSLGNADYAITENGCSATLQANASCAVTVIFIPNIDAPDPGSVVITDDAAVGTTIVLLSGNGVDVAYVLPFEIFFDGQAMGTPSTPQEAIFTNMTDGAVTVTPATIAGHAAGDFSASAGCNGSIANAGTCTSNVVFTPKAAGPRTADLTIASSTTGVNYVSHLTGNGAIRHLPGFTANTLPPNDDGSTENAVALPFTLNFFGTNFTSLWVNNNGNVTFGEPLSDFTPNGLNGDNGGIPIIAPFWADVDTTGAVLGGSADVGAPPSAVVTFGLDTVNGHQAFGVNYENVGYYGSHTDKLNSFQLVLIDRSDTGIAGAFDIEFNYDKIQWEVGDASGGTDGLCGAVLPPDCVPAAAGYSNGTGTAGTNFQLDGSLVAGAMLDSGPAATALINTGLGSAMQGRSVFQVRNGAVQSADLGLAMTQSTNPVPAGSNQTYTLTVTNAGPNDATNVTVTDTLPTNATLVSATPSQGAACTGSAPLTCNLGTVANAASATLTIVVTVNAGATGTLANTASVVSDQLDPNKTNNTASVSAPITAAANVALTITEGGTGTGTVTSAPAGINCPATACTANFASGTQITLTATGTGGSTFTGWGGATCEGTGTCTFTITTATTVPANFAAGTTNFALTVTEAGTGTGTVASAPAGINCPTTTCTANFASGTMVTLTPTGTGGSTFTGWGGACAGTGACVVTMSAAEAVTATFTAATTNFALTVTEAGTGTGTVTSAPAGINCPTTTCTANFASGTKVTLTPTGTGGSTFTGWGGACTGTGACVVTMSAVEAVTATFTAATTNFALTVTEAGTGTGTVSSAPEGIACPETCTANFASGTKVALTPTGTSGSTFAGWSGACTGTGGCMVTMSAAEAVTATFNASGTAVVITVPAGGSTTATTVPGGTAFYGLLITGAEGVTGTATLGCISSSPLITCNVIPGTVKLTGGTVEVAFGVQTFCQGATQTGGMTLPGGAGGMGTSGGLGLLVLGLMLGGAAWTMKGNRRMAMTLAMLMIVTLGSAACGGGLAKGPNGITPAGTYTLTLTATVNGQTQTLPNFLTLIVN